MGRSNALIIVVLPVLVALAVVFSSNLSALFGGLQDGGAARPAASSSTSTAPLAPATGAPTVKLVPVKPKAAAVESAPAEMTVPAHPLVLKRPPNTAPARPRTLAESAPSVASTQEVSTLPPLVRGRQLAALLYDDQLDRLWKAFLPQARAEWGGLAAFRAYRAGGLKAYGAETKVVRERVVGNGGLTYYTRTSTFERGPKAGWTLILGLTPEGQVRQFGIVAAGALPDKGRPNKKP